MVFRNKTASPLGSLEVQGWSITLSTERRCNMGSAPLSMLPVPTGIKAILVGMQSPLVGMRATLVGMKVTLTGMSVALVGMNSVIAVMVPSPAGMKTAPTVEHGTAQGGVGTNPRCFYIPARICFCM